MSDSLETQKVILDKKNLKTISLGLSLPVGSADEPIPGITNVLVEHMLRNTEGKDEDAFAEYIDQYGITVNGSSGRTRTSFGVTTPPQHLERAFDILKEMVLKPNFIEGTVQQLVQRTSSQIQQMKSTPEPILTNYTSWRATYGNDPISRHPLGNPEDLGTITVDSLISWHDEIKKLKMFFAGVGVGLKESNLENLDGFLGEFGNRKLDTATISPPIASLKSESDVPAMASSNAYIGVNLRLPSAKELNMEQDIYNAVVSGGMSARLFTEIRENRNLSYAPRSQMSSFRGGTKVSSIMDVRRERAEEALETTLNLTKDVLTTPIPQDEMNRALKAAQRIAVFVADSSSGYTSYLLSRITAGLEHDLDKVKIQLENAAASNWQERLLKEWKPQNLSFAVSGDVGDIKEKWPTYAEKVM